MTSELRRTQPWRLLSLLPFDEDESRTVLGDLAERTELTLLPRPGREALHDALASAELILAAWQGTHRLPLQAEEVAAAGPGLTFVQQPSVGTDSLDLAGFAARGIPVANTRGANARSVAEWVVGAAIALARSIVWADARVRAGEWPQLQPAERGQGEIGDLRIGVVGFGDVGQSVATLFRGLGCDVAYWSQTRRPGPSAWFDLPSLCGRSDILVICLPLTPDTGNLVDSTMLALLPPGATVVNVGRGGVLDEAALLAHLESGHLSGAALDVHAEEPLPPDHPVFSHERVLLSPHSAGNTRQSIARVNAQAVANLRRVLDGEPVIDVVNGVSPVVKRRVVAG